MRSRPVISVAAAVGLIETIEAAGGNPDQILQASGVNRSVLSKAEGFLPCSVFAEILKQAAQATGDDCFGLHFGERFDPKNIGPLVYVALNSPTVGAGIENVKRYLHVYDSSANWFFTTEGNRGYIRYLLNQPGAAPLRQSNEHGMVLVLNAMRMMVGSQWSPLEVQFEHEAPGQTSEHNRVFRAPVLFGCETNALVIGRDLIDREVPAADPQLYAIMKHYLDEILSTMPREDGFVASIRKGIAESMRDGDPTLVRVAKKMATGARTLQRRLKDYGFEFKKLVEDTRRRLSLIYLKDDTNTLTEVAFLLGYSELSAFNRAFKRWTGSTPLDYRRGIVRPRATG